MEIEQFKFSQKMGKKLQFVESGELGPDVGPAQSVKLLHFLHVTVKCLVFARL